MNKITPVLFAAVIFSCNQNNEPAPVTPLQAPSPQVVIKEREGDTLYIGNRILYLIPAKEF